MDVELVTLTGEGACVIAGGMKIETQLSRQSATNGRLTCAGFTANNDEVFHNDLGGGGVRFGHFLGLEAEL